MSLRLGPWDSLNNIVGDVSDLQAGLSTLEDINVKTTFFEQINSGLSGTITPPASATIDLDEFGGGVDAVVSKMSGGFPTYEIATESDDTPITATLNDDGEWAISGTPSAYPVALIYAYRVAIGNFDHTKSLVDSELSLDITAILTRAQEWTAQQNFDEQSITSSGNSVAWDLNSAQVAVHTLTENTTISSPTNMKAGGTYILRIVQGSGPYTLAWNAVFDWGAAGASAEPSANGDLIVVSFYSDGSAMYAVEILRKEA